MGSELKDEVIRSLQFFAMALISVILAFFHWISPEKGQNGQLIEVNIGAAWSAYSPVARFWLTAFASLCLIRLLIVYIARKRLNK